MIAAVLQVSVVSARAIPACVEAALAGKLCASLSKRAHVIERRQRFCE
jgi:hypothetical protein